MTLRETAQALVNWYDGPPYAYVEDEMVAHIDAIRAALAASESPSDPERLDEPGAWVSRDLLLRAVDLRAVAWNALGAVPAGGGSWERFWRKLHELRESVNRPEHEDIRIVYAGTYPNSTATERGEHRVLDEHWRIVAARLNDTAPETR